MDYSTQTSSVVPSPGRLTLNRQFPLGEPATAEAIDSPDPDNHPNFIESNTNAITLEELSNNLIPTWADNSLTISHTNFIKTVRNAAVQVFGNLTPVEIRTSHPIQGRRPEAIHKKQNELTENDKTIYYQRMAFISHVVGLSREVNGQIVNLTIGGVRNYADDQLYRTATPQRFKVFVGWQVRVCSNMMLTCNGNSGVIQCLTDTARQSPDNENERTTILQHHRAYEIISSTPDSRTTHPAESSYRRPGSKRSSQRILQQPQLPQKRG